MAGDSRNVACMCGSGKKQKKCHPDIYPESRAGMVLDLYRRLDEIIQSHYTRSSAQRPPCQKGCCACCYHNFSVTRTEFNLIIRELKTWPAEKIQELLATVQTQLNQVAANYPEYHALQDRKPGAVDMLTQLMTLTDSLGVPCPFLDTETGACRVYAARPWVCRHHGVATITMQEHQVCEKIPSNVANAQITPNVSELTEAYADARYVKIGPNELGKDVEYPILYWLRRSFVKWLATGKIEISMENEDFRTPLNVSARHQLEVAIRQNQGLAKGRYRPFGR